MIQRGKVILLLTLFLILALPYFESNLIVDIKVVKRDLIPTVTSQTRLDINTESSKTKDSTETNYYISETRSNGISAYEWSALPLLSFFGFTAVLNQILQDA